MKRYECKHYKHTIQLDEMKGVGGKRANNIGKECAWESTIITLTHQLPHTFSDWLKPFSEARHHLNKDHKPQIPNAKWNMQQSIQAVITSVNLICIKYYLMFCFFYFSFSFFFQLHVAILNETHFRL